MAPATHAFRRVSLGSALSFLTTMSVGAIIGAVAMSWFADRIGPRAVATCGFGIGVLALIIMSTGPPTAVLYVAVALAGVGANGTAVIDEQAFLDRIPMKRFGRPAEVAELAYFLGTPLAGYITGTVVPIDGGWSAQGIG